jgi:hypothetical protein
MTSEATSLMDDDLRAAYARVIEADRKRAAAERAAKRDADRLRLERLEERVESVPLLVAVNITAFGIIFLMFLYQQRR